MANFDTIDELKIKISVEESGSVKTSLDEIIDKLNKIDKAGGGKIEKFESFLSTLASMDKSLSKISISLTRVSTGISTIAAHAKLFGDKFSGSLNNIDDGMKNVANAANKTGESFKKISTEAGAFQKTDLRGVVSEATELEMRINGIQKKLAKEQSLGDMADEEKLANLNKRLRLALADLDKYNAKQDEMKSKAREAFDTIAQMTEKANSKVLLLASGSERASEALNSIKIVTSFDDSSLAAVTENVEQLTPALNNATGAATEFKTVLNETTDVEAPYKQYDTQELLAHMDDYIGSIQKAVSEEERLSAIDMSKQFTQIDLLQEKYNELADKLAVMMREDGFGGKSFANVIGEMHRLAAQMDKIRQSEIEVSLAAERMHSPLVRFAAIGRTLQSAVEGPLKNVATAMLKIQTFPIARVGKSLGDIGKKLKGVVKSFLRVAKMRAFRYAIRQVTQGIREGVNNAYQWAKIMGNDFAGSMDRISTASLYLKNSLGAMAMPLINIVAPAIDYVIDRFVDLLNAANRVFAMLRGQSTWTKALRYPKEFAEGLNSASGAAEKLNDELITILGIDEINPMEAMKDSAGGGGGGSSVADDYASMFEEVALTTENIFGGLFDPLKRAWDNKGQGVITSINNAMEGIRTLAESVGNSFWNVWTNGTGQKTVEHILGIFEGISNTIGNIAKQLAKGWNTDNLGTKIIQNLWDSLNDILGMWERIATATSNWAKTVDFTPAIRSFEGLTEKLKPFIKLLTDNLAWAWENIVLPFGTWAIEKLLPKIFDIAGGILEVATAVGEKLTPVLQWLWDNIFKPLAEGIGQQILDILQAVIDLLDFLADPTKALKEAIGNRDLSDYQDPLANRDIGGYNSNSKLDYEGGITLSAKVIGEDYEQKFPDPETNSVANLTSKKESFDTTTGKMTANLTKKTEGFNKTTGKMTAYLYKKSEKFNKTTGKMTAYLSKKSEVFGKTTGKMTAWLKDKEEDFSYKTKPMTAQITDFVLYGVTTGNGRASFRKNGGIFQNGFWKNIPQYAGGTLNAGSLFVAGEAGAELVGHIGGRTEVLNQSQLAAAMAASMANANAGQNRLLQEQNGLLRELINKQVNGRAYVTSGDIVDGLTQRNRRDGRTIVSVG